MAEGVESTPSDALPLSRSFSPLLPVSPCNFELPSFFTRLSISLFPNLPLSFSSPHRGEYLDIGDIAFFSFLPFHQEVTLSLPTSPSLFLPSFLPRTSTLSPYWSVLHPPCSRLHIHVRLPYSFQPSRVIARASA